MKKLLVVAVIAAFTLAGCGSKSENVVDTNTTSSVVATTPSTSTTPSNATTTVTPGNALTEQQLSQLEGSVNNAQSTLDQTDQLTTDD